MLSANFTPTHIPCMIQKKHLLSRAPHQLCNSDYVALDGALELAGVPIHLVPRRRKHVKLQTSRSNWTPRMHNYMIA